MAYSYTPYVGDGSTTIFNVQIPYLLRDHIKLLVEGVEVTFTWLDAVRVQADVAPILGAVVWVKRTTPVDVPIVDFQDGSVLGESDLDAPALQALYISQETKDDAGSLIELALDDTYDINNKRLKNVADPVNPQDAVTKQWTETTSTSVLGQTIAAKDAAVAAQGLSETAKDASVAAQGASVVAKDASVIAKDASVAAQGLSETAQTASVAAQGLSEAARDASVVAKDASVAAQGLSEAAKDASVVAKDASVAAQGLSETAKDASVVAKDASVAAQGLSETAQANAALEKTYATEWATKAVDTLVSVAAGGNGIDDYSALHWAAKAAESGGGVPLLAGTIQCYMLQITQGIGVLSFLTGSTLSTGYVKKVEYTIPVFLAGIARFTFSAYNYAGVGTAYAQLYLNGVAYGAAAAAAGSSTVTNELDITVEAGDVIALYARHSNPQFGYSGAGCNATLYAPKYDQGVPPLSGVWSSSDY